MAKASHQDPYEQEYREEAERLAQLPAEEQAKTIAWHREIASDRQVSRANRRLAAERADALERHLKSRPKRKRKNS